MRNLLLFPLLLLIVVGCKQPAEDDDTLDTKPLVDDLATQWLEDEPAADQYWDWMDAVYMMGFLRVYELTGKTTQLGYTEEWVDRYYDEIEEGGRFPDASDRVAPNIIPVEIMRIHGDDRYPAVPEQVDEYLATVPRTANGAILHWGTHFPDKREVLIDSLFMFGGYMVGMYELTGDEAYLDQFVEQVGYFDELCRDDAEGLFLHAWDEDAQANITDETMFWARGNAWIVAVTASYLSVAPEDHDGRAYIEEIYLGEIDGFIRYQDTTGLFHTILDRPDEVTNYTETSSTALFLYGASLGLKTGVLDAGTYRPAVVAAHDGVRLRVVEDDDGHMTTVGTSFGTVPSWTNTYDNYVGIPLVEDLPMGVGAVMMGLAAADGI